MSSRILFRATLVKGNKRNEKKKERKKLDRANMTDKMEHVDPITTRYRTCKSEMDVQTRPRCASSWIKPRFRLFPAFSGLAKRCTKVTFLRSASDRIFICIYTARQDGRRNWIHREAVGHFSQQQQTSPGVCIKRQIMKRAHIVVGHARPSLPMEIRDLALPFTSYARNLRGMRLNVWGFDLKCPWTAICTLITT